MTLEGILHLGASERVRFALEESAAVSSLVAQVMSGKLWSRPTLVIAEARHLMALSPAEVVRADLSAHPEVESAWNRFLQSDDALTPSDSNGASQSVIVREEIAADAYHEGAARMATHIASRDELVSTPGQNIEVFGRFSLRGGATVHHRYALAVPDAFEQRRFLANVFALSSQPFRALPAFPDAPPGLAVLNPHAIVTATFHPGATPTADTWKVDAVYLETAQGIAL